MPNWANLMLTKKGKALQAKAVAGELLTITKMKLGSGTIPDGVSPEDLNDLIQPKQILGLTAIEAKGNLAKIQSLITNVDLSEGYYIRECGVFAQDPDEGEIMYAIMTDTSPDFLPPIGGSVVISEEFSINIAMENVSHITAIIDPDGLVTVTNARKIAADAVEAHNTAESVHSENIASQEEAEAQTNQNNIKFMTPLRVWDAIKKFAAAAVFTGIVKTIAPNIDSDDDSVPTTSWVLTIIRKLFGEHIVKDKSISQTGFVQGGDWVGGLTVQWGIGNPNADYDIYYPIAMTSTFTVLPVDSGMDPFSVDTTHFAQMISYGTSGFKVTEIFAGDPLIVPRTDQYIAWFAVGTV